MEKVPALDCLATLVNFGYCSNGPYGPLWEFAVDSYVGSLTVLENKSEVILETIDIEPAGSGLGSAIFLALRDYCDQSGKELIVPGVMNLEFFARFDFLCWQEPQPGGELWRASYAPAACESAA